MNSAVSPSAKSASAVVLGLCLAVGPTVACGDDGTGGTGGSGANGGNGGEDGTGGTPATGGGGDTSTGGGGAGEGGGTGGMASCDALPPGPFDPVLATDQFAASEDIVFDGIDSIVGKDGNQIVRVDSDDQKTPLAALSGVILGLRYDAAGALIAADFGAGTLTKIVDGTPEPFVDGLAGPNGVYGDSVGNVWVTEFNGNQVVVVDPDGNVDVVAMGAPVSSPNGIVLDEDRDLLFFTNYSDGTVYSVDPAGGEPVLVGGVEGASLDGLVMDICGNVYAVDNGNDRVYRFNLDAGGALVGEPELIAQIPAGVANAQFGAGLGWNANSLYVAGNPGEVYEVPVGVRGVPVPHR